MLVVPGIDEGHTSDERNTACHSFLINCTLAVKRIREA